MREHFRTFVLHQMGEHATHPIARFWLRPRRLTIASLTLAFTETSLSGCRALLLLNHIGSHAASSRLGRQPGKSALVRVQLRNLD
jgi:hypothetical protein